MEVRKKRVAASLDRTVVSRSPLKGQKRKTQVSLELGLRRERIGPEMS